MAGDSTVNSSKFAISTKPMSARKAIVLESTGFGIAELASMGVSLGAVALADKLIPGSIMEKATDTIAKICIEPYLDTIEKTIAKCKLKECQVDETKSREERACRLARGVVIFGAAYVLSLGAKSVARHWLNESFDVPGQKRKIPASDAKFVDKMVHHIPFYKWTNEERIIFAADEAVHIGSLIYLNTKASKFTDSHIKTMSKTLEKLGVSPQKAKDVSTMAMVWEVPNFLGMVAGGGVISGKHAYGWPYKHEYQKISKILDGTAKSIATPHSIGT